MSTVSPIRSSNMPPIMSQWFRKTLFASAIINFLGAFILFPYFQIPTFLRNFVGFPEASLQFYPLLVSVWIAFFGVAYLWLALRQKNNLMFFCFTACGKLSFAIAIIFFYLQGSLGFLTLSTALVDFVLAVLFLAYIIIKGFSKIRT